MEIVRYAIVFATVAFVGAAVAAVLFAGAAPLIARHRRGTDLGRAIVACLNGAAVGASVMLAYWFCTLTGAPAKYLMYLPPLLGMVRNGRHRIARMKEAPTLLGQYIDAEPGQRSGMVRTEQLNAAADLFGFVVGLIALPGLDFF